LWGGRYVAGKYVGWWGWTYSNLYYSRRHRKDMKRLLVILAAFALTALVAFGMSCREEGIKQISPNIWSPGGVGVLVPAWLEARAPTKVAQVLAEIDAAGVPKGWVIIIEVPVFVSSYRDITIPGDKERPGLVRGVTYYATREMYVGWRMSCEPEIPFLPALLWEAANARGEGLDPFVGSR
jgi:hypothetical protein